MNERVAHDSAPSWYLLFGAVMLGLVLGALAARPASAGEGIINVNQHKTQPYVPDEQVPGDSCTNVLTGCAEGQSIPEDALGQYLLVDANAYHVGTECKFAKVRCKYDHYSRPKIVSSDDGYVAHDVAESFMQAIAARPVGQYHYEYWDECLTEHAKRSFVIPNTTGDPFPDADTCHFDYGLPAFGSQDMIEWIGNSQNGVVSESATMLLQNGWLHRDLGSPRKFKWKAWDADATPAGFVDSAKRLMGFGYMGVLGAGPERLLAEPYMRELRRYNINFVRVWAIEMWTALRDPEGPTPFLGSHLPNGYDLFEDNPVFYRHLRNVAQQAADRGIVVQLTNFDIHGLIYHQANYRYKDSPYRDQNNNTVWTPDYEWLANTIPGCGNPLGEEPHPFPPSDEPEARNCHALDSFVLDADMQAVHRRFLRRVGEEVGGIGNLMFEIINEALAPATVDNEPGDWPTSTWSPRLARTTTRNQAWQAEMAAQMRLALPLSGVARDAFNGDNDGTALNGKAADVAGMNWWASNAKVKVATTESAVGSLGPSRKLGYATSQGTASMMQASLPLSSASVAWTKAQVRADVTLFAPGGFEMGLSLLGPKEVFVQVEAGANESVPYTVRLIERHPGGDTLRGSFTVGGTTHNYRLKVVLPPPGELPAPILRADLFVDGTAMLESIPVGTVSGYTRGFFRAADGSNPYPPDRAQIDNFEAARFCDDETRGCTPDDETGSEE